MKPKIFLTGSSGFVGSYLQKALANKFHFETYKRGELPEISAELVIHLAGLAHDLKKTNNELAYFDVNVGLTKLIFDAFLASNDTKVFVFISSVKAVADSFKGILTEEQLPVPETAYGKSKLEAERYLLSQVLPKNKRLYILRPSVIHGPESKGNLALLQKFVSCGLPWPLAAFQNRRSYCSIQNLTFVIEQLYAQSKVPSGIYNVVDNEPLSTNELISIMAASRGKKMRLWSIPKRVIIGISKIGDIFKLPLNSERLDKLTESFEVSNKKLLDAIGAPLPVTSREGLLQNLNPLVND
jgi:nucleoside-diphosphate-sugar epimerase